jgi:hypothetical protein
MAYTQERKDITLKMLNDPGSWPNWPLLPVKRDVSEYGFDEAAGVMVPGQTVVYFMNMWEFRTGSINAQVQGKPFKSYPDFEGVIDDGWVVD